LKGYSVNLREKGDSAGSRRIMKKVKVKSFYLMVSRKEGEGGEKWRGKNGGKIFFSFFSFFLLSSSSVSLRWQTLLCQMIVPRTL